MIFKTAGDKSKPAILFFHAMGVTGDSSMPVAECLERKYYCIMPTSTVYCAGQKYRSKTDEIQQIMALLKEQGYTKEQVDMIQNGIHNRIAENYEKRQAVHRRRVIAEKMITELTDRMEKQREQKMLENRERETRQPKR